MSRKKKRKKLLKPRLPLKIVFANKADQIHSDKSKIIPRKQKYKEELKD